MAEEARAVPLWFTGFFVVVLWLLLLRSVLSLGVIAVGEGNARVIRVSASLSASVIH